jgi:hypothetical protein
LVALMVLELVFAFVVGGDVTVIDNNPILTILAGALSIAVTIVGPLSFFIGIIAFIKQKEWLVFRSLAVLYVVVVLLFLLGEFRFPH